MGLRNSPIHYSNTPVLHHHSIILYVLNGLNDLNCLNEFIRLMLWLTKII